MTRKSPFPALATAAAIALLAFSAPTTGHASSVGVNINLSGYMPVPAGVQIHVESGRPYYVENHRRVYVKKKGDRGKHKGHYKHDDDGRGKGHGKKHDRD